MRSKIASGIALLLVVAACSGGGAPAGTWLYGPTASPSAASAAPSPSAASPSAAPSPAATDASPSAAATPGGDAEQVTIGTDTGSDLQFDPATVSVDGGGTVEVTFSNLSIVPHNLTFQDPINAATATVVDPEASDVFTFEAPAPGDYTFVCTLHPGMEGTLTIEGP